MTARLERHTEETLRHTDTQTHRLTRHTARAELPHIPSEQYGTASQALCAKDGAKACDWQCYLNRYADLRKDFGDANVNAAAAHFRRKGKAEGRNCSCPGSAGAPVPEYCTKASGTANGTGFLHVLQRRGRGTFHQPSGSFPVYRPPPHVLLRMVRGRVDGVRQPAGTPLTPPPPLRDAGARTSGGRRMSQTRSSRRRRVGEPVPHLDRLRHSI